ncbi:MAG: hypothetical protein L0Y55_06030, partial [Anaerolineales bacterium]|nr:hypothetical protein [Anaerolineales bacterium]
PGFLPRGFNLYTINYTRRDWTMIGNLDHTREAIVDPRGVVTPWFDGWSLDVWIEHDGKLIAPSRLRDDEIEQSLYENLPIVVTTFRANDLRVRLESFAIEQDAREFVVEQITVENSTRTSRAATLYLAIRPFNPEGTSLIKNIAFHSSPTDSSLILHPSSFAVINHAPGIFLPQPDAIACSNFDASDVALALPNLNGKTRVHCDAGLTTAVAAYRIELGAGQSKTLTALMPLEREELDDDDEFHVSSFVVRPSSNSLDQTVALWRAELARGMCVRLPDEKLQAAFDANKAFLLLLADGDTITPGPFTYHQFWFRDAAYLLNAFDKLGYHAEARAVIEKFPRRLQKDGYLRATEGEWDSNGAAIWAMVEHARLSGNT